MHSLATGRPQRYSSKKMLNADQLRRIEENRRYLAERSPESNRRVAAWLRELRPSLSDPQARVADRMAADLEAYASEVQVSRSVPD
jgi:hypothetical protein